MEKGIENKLDQIIFLLKEIHKCTAYNAIQDKNNLYSYMEDCQDRVSEIASPGMHS